MGISHRIYKLKGKYSFEDAESVIKNIYGKLVEGDSIAYWFNLKLNNISDYQIIEQKYPVFERNEYFFQIKIPNSQIFNQLLQNETCYNRFNIYSHKDQLGTFVPYLGYSIYFNSEIEEIRLLINLTYTDIEESKNQLTKVIRHLVKSNLFFIVDSEIELISNTIIDLNSSNYQGSWKYKDRIEISARPDITPKGEKMARPSCVQFKFDKQFLDRWYEFGVYNKVQQINRCISEVITDVDCFKGLIYTKDLSNFIEETNQIDKLNLTTNIGLDLSRNFNYSLKDISQLSGIISKELHLENFKWKDANSIRRDGFINLNFENNNWDLEIMVDKHIDESYKNTIESVIGFNLEEAGWL